jgi:hypothetical protein
MENFTPFSRRWNFALFSNVDDLRQFVNQNPKVVSEPNDFIDLLSSPFKDIGMFEEAREKIETLANSIDLGGAFEKSKLKITDNPSGIFDFGLASLGLQRLVEFYSAELEQKHPRAFEQDDAVAGLVPNVLVEKNDFEQYFVEYDGTRYLLEKRQKGTTILKRANPSLALIEKNGMMIPKNSTDPEIARELGFTSSQKKSYIEFEKLGGKTPYIDIIIPLNFLVEGYGVNALRSILPAVMAAKFFERAGVQTRIMVGRVAADDTGWSRWLLKPYKDDVANFLFRTIPPAPNGINKTASAQENLKFADLIPPAYYEVLPIANTVVMTTVKDRGKETDYNVIGQLLVNSTGKNSSAEIGYNMFLDKQQDGAKNFRSGISTGGKGLWYTYPSIMTMVGRVFGKYVNYVAKNNLWGDKREMGSYIPTSFTPTPALLTLGSWVATQEYDLEQSIKDDSLLLHNHPFGYSFWMLIDRAELALSSNSAKVMKRIHKRLNEEGYGTQEIEDYLKEVSNSVFSETAIDPKEMLELAFPAQASTISQEAVPPQYYPQTEEMRKFYAKKGEEFLRSYQDMLNRMKP